MRKRRSRQDRVLKFTTGQTSTAKRGKPLHSNS
jgi:hypothetical protein